MKNKISIYLLWLISWFVVSMMACAVNDPSEISAVPVSSNATIAVTRPTHTPLSASPTPLPLATALNTPTPTITAVPSPDPLTPILITTEPIFEGPHVRFGGWSPNGRFLVYQEYTEEQVAESKALNMPDLASGTFTFYDVMTGAKCQAYPLVRSYIWLPDGDLFMITTTGEVLQIDMPCGNEENLTTLFPESLSTIISFSPDNQWLLLGGNHYWLYNHETRDIRPTEEPLGDSYNNVVWSPNGRYIGIVRSGTYGGSSQPIDGSLIVEASTGQTVARYDWEVGSTVDGIYGGPVWISETEMVITVSLDQGPFFMSVSGEIRPLLPLFGLTLPADGSVPEAKPYTDPETGHYHIFLDNMSGGSSEIPPQVYHSDTGQVEMLPIEPVDDPYVTTDGYIIAQSWGRHITAEGEPLTEFSLGNCLSGGSPSSILPMRARQWQSKTNVTIYGPPDCTPISNLQFAEYDNSYNLLTVLSPDGSWLAVIPFSGYGWGSALFVIPLENLRPVLPN